MNHVFFYVRPILDMFLFACPIFYNFTFVIRAVHHRIRDINLKKIEKEAF